MTVLDHLQDTTGTVQHQLLQLYPAPDFVKTAAHEQLHGSTENPLPSHVYADNLNRVYPCHSKAATWMSALFFGRNLPELTETAAESIRTRLKTAAASWGISQDVQSLWEKMAADSDTSLERLPDSMFGLVWVDEQQNKTRRYPLRNAAEVEKAAAWFNQYGREFVFSDRHTLANRILTKAAAYDAAISDTSQLDQAAGMGHCSPSDVSYAWKLRASVLRHTHSEHAANAEKMASAMADAREELQDRSYRVTIAEVMDRFDRETGLQQKYASVGLTCPEEVLFRVTEKVAQQVLDDHVELLTGRIYEKSALQAITVPDLRKWLGDDIADDLDDGVMDIEKLAAVIMTLPRPDAMTFDRMAKSLGIPAVRYTKEAAEELPHEKLLQYAAAYVPR